MADAIRLARAATATGNQQNVVWGGVPLSGLADEGAGATYLVNAAGVAIDTVTDSSDGKIALLEEARLYVWDSVGLAWVKATGTSGGAATYTPQKSTTGTFASVASSITVVTLQALNAARLGWTCTNESTANLYLKLGAAASLTSYTLVLGGAPSAPYAYYEVPFNYTGIITGIWDAANGFARAGEYT